jgi:putative ABC transport system permease protein
MPHLIHFPLGLKILTYAPGRLAVSLAGILLAVVLMFSQTGFRNAMFDSQKEIIVKLDGDLFILNKLRHIMYDPTTFAIRRIYQAKAVAGVREVLPLYIEGAASVWKNPDRRNRDKPRLRRIRVLAFGMNRPEDAVFKFPEVSAHIEALKMPDTVLFDEASRDYYGNPRAGTRTELAGREVTVVGTFRLGTDFLTDGNVIMSDRNFERYFPDRFSRTPILDKVAIGVVRLEPWSDVERVQADLQAALAADVKVLTKQQLIDKETEYWQQNTAIGDIFLLGMIVAVTVGMIICYQILYTNVSNYLPQFATLKAIGFSDFYLVRVVLEQALFLSLFGFIPALLAAQVLFWTVSGLTGLLMFFTLPRIAQVLSLTVAMCLVSGTLAMRRVLTADPAEVFK